MTLPKLESFDESVGPALASLTDTIGSLIKPTAKYDQALKALFLEKPEMMQKFVDVEKANPGTLKAFGFGEGATNFLKGMEESIPSIRQRLGKDVLETSPGSRATAGQVAATGETPAEVQGAALKKYLLEGGLDLAKKDPQAFDAGIRKLLDIGTKQELQVEQDTAGVYAGGRKLADLSVPDIVKGIQSGTIKNQDISAGLLHPAASAGVRAALGEYQFEREAALRRDLAQMAGERTRAGSTALEASLRRASYDQFKASGGVAPIGAFYEVMWGEPYKGTPAPPEQIKAVEGWLKTSQGDKEVARKKALFSGLRPLYDQTVRKKGARPPTKDLVQKNIRQMNDLLGASGSPWRAEYDEIGHWFKANEPQVVFRDQAGNISKDATPVFSEVPSTDTMRATDDPPPLGGYERQVQQQIIALPPDQWDAALQQLRDNNVPDSTIQNIIDNLPAQ